jgi:hypothetical protein
VRQAAVVGSGRRADHLALNSGPPGLRANAIVGAVSGTVSCLLCGGDENYFLNDPIGCAAQSVGVFRHPVLAAFGKKIKKIPDGRKLIDSSMMSLSERCLGGIEMVDFPVGGTAENADAGSL